MTNTQKILIAIGTIATAYFIATVIKSSFEALKTDEHITNNHSGNNMGPFALPLEH